MACPHTTYIHTRTHKQTYRTVQFKQHDALTFRTVLTISHSMQFRRAAVSRGSMPVSTPVLLYGILRLRRQRRWRFFSALKRSPPLRGVHAYKMLLFRETNCRTATKFTCAPLYPVLLLYVPALRSSADVPKATTQKS